MSASGTYSYWPKVNNPNKQYIQMESGGNQPMFFFGGSQVPLAFGLNHVHGSGISGPEPRPMYKVSPIREEDVFQTSPRSDDLLKLQRGRNRTYGRGIKPIYKDEFNNEVKELSGRGIDHPTISLSDHVDKIYIPRHLGSMHR